MPPKISVTQAVAADFEELADIRVAAMRESLERLGRFDLSRAKERLRTSFRPESTWIIVVEHERVGFYATHPTTEGLLLDHLYVDPAHQSRGIGGYVLNLILEVADQQGIAVLVGALKESASNRFYQRHGFILTSETEWDNYYARPASKSAIQDYPAR